MKYSCKWDAFEKCFLIGDHSFAANFDPELLDLVVCLRHLILALLQMMNWTLPVPKNIKPCNPTDFEHVWCIWCEPDLPDHPHTTNFYVSPCISYFVYMHIHAYT